MGRLITSSPRAINTFSHPLTTASLRVLTLTLAMLVEMTALMTAKTFDLDSMARLKLALWQDSFPAKGLQMHYLFSPAFFPTTNYLSLKIQICKQSNEVRSILLSHLMSYLVLSTLESTITPMCQQEPWSRTNKSWKG